MNKRRKEYMKRKARWLALFLVFGLIVAACGGDDNNSSAPDAAVDAAPEVDAAPAVPTASCPETRTTCYAAFRW